MIFPLAAVPSRGLIAPAALIRSARLEKRLNPLESLLASEMHRCPGGRCRTLPTRFSSLLLPLSPLRDVSSAIVSRATVRRLLELLGVTWALCAYIEAFLLELEPLPWWRTAHVERDLEVRRSHWPIPNPESKRSMSLPQLVLLAHVGTGSGVSELLSTAWSEGNIVDTFF